MSGYPNAKRHGPYPPSYPSPAAVPPRGMPSYTTVPTSQSTYAPYQNQHLEHDHTVFPRYPREGLDERRRALEADRDALQRRIDELTRRQEEWARERGRLVGSLDVAKRATRDLQVEKEREGGMLRGEIEELKGSVDTWRSVAEEARAKLRTDISQPGSTTVNTEIAPATGTADSSSAPLTDGIPPSESKTDLHDIRAELENSRSKVAELQDELDTAQDQVVELMMENEKAQRELAELRSRPAARIVEGDVGAIGKQAIAASERAPTPDVEPRIVVLEEENAHLLSEKIDLLRRNVVMQVALNDAFNARQETREADVATQESVLDALFHQNQRTVEGLEIARDLAVAEARGKGQEVAALRQELLAADKEIRRLKAVLSTVAAYAGSGSEGGGNEGARVVPSMVCLSIPFLSLELIVPPADTRRGRIRLLG